MTDYKYNTDFARWADLIADKQILSHELENIHKKIMETSDMGLSYFCALEFPYKSYRMQNIILENKDPYYAYLFAKDIKNADIKSLQNIVIASKNMQLITKFACFVDGSDKKAIEKLVIKSGNSKYAHMLLKYVKGVYFYKKLKQTILSSGKPRYLFELAKHANQKEVALIEDLIIKSGNFTYMRLFAEKIKMANVEKLEQAVLDSGNNKEIKKFAAHVRKSKMRKFLLIA